jgi:hypothetical protein
MFMIYLLEEELSKASTARLSRSKKGESSWAASTRASPQTTSNKEEPEPSPWTESY